VWKQRATIGVSAVDPEKGRIADNVVNVVARDIGIARGPETETETANTANVTEKGESFCYPLQDFSINIFI
jgi:hypothetical protein